MDSERAYSPEFKAKVVLEVMRERKSADQIYSDYGVPGDLLDRWTQEFLENAYLAFANRESEFHRSRRIEELENLVGKLSRDLDTSSRALRFMSRVLSTRIVQ
jgi:putative transposase